MYDFHALGLVQTGLGLMCLKDYLAIRACEAGYGSYRDAYEDGWRLRGYEHITPDDLL